MKIVSRVMLMAVFIAHILLIKNNAFSQDYDDNYYDSEFYSDYFVDDETAGKQGNPLYNSIMKVIDSGYNTDLLIEKGDFEGALESAQVERKVLLDTRKLYMSMEDSLSAKERQAVKALFEMFDRLIDINMKTAQQQIIREKVIAGAKKIKNTKEAEDFLPQLEILERATAELLEQVDSHKAFINELIAKEVFSDLQEMESVLPEINLSGGIAWADESRKILTNYINVIQQSKKDLLDKAPEYESFREEDIPAEDKKEITMDEKIITSDLEAVFKKFDKNNDGKISLGEGEDFFYWMEKNVQYRYDDENAEDPYQGSVVGDGHPGNDYRQTPQETLEDEMGDCEDMATMESTFYNYWGIESYVIGVNAVNEKELDHAAAIVKLSETPEKFKQIFGNLVSYDIKSGAKDIYGKPVSPGTYFLADNAYSSAFGYLSGGIEKGKFKLLCTVPADKPFHKYDEEEASRVWGYCGPSD